MEATRVQRMSAFAVRTERLGKRYEFGPPGPSYLTLREAVVQGVASGARWVGRAVGRGAAPRGEILWALADVSLEIEAGEVVGIIGRNGAGKSTLLKILARITEPTSGFAEIRGRLGSLLEVGAGFHPELTGRENVYLNGAIIGMSQREIARKFDEIVAFAGIEPHLDRPTKYYSSGMYMRLAFAVAAHLEPDILLVDEVLAVGDAEFQKKCLNKMQDVGREGRTVLFVSHNMAAVARLCDRVLLLEEGRVAQDGPAADVVSRYLTSDLGTTAAREWTDAARAPQGEVVRLRAVRVLDERRTASATIDIRRPLSVEMEYDVLKPDHRLRPYFRFTREDGTIAFTAAEAPAAAERTRRACGRYRSRVAIPGNFLAEGMMLVGAGCVTVSPVIAQFWEPDVVGFHVVDTVDGDSARADFGGRIPGVVRPLLPWDVEAIDD